MFHSTQWYFSTLVMILFMEMLWYYSTSHVVLFHVMCDIIHILPWYLSPSGIILLNVRHDTNQWWRYIPFILQVVIYFPNVLIVLTVTLILCTVDVILFVGEYDIIHVNVILFDRLPYYWYWGVFLFISQYVVISYMNNIMILVSEDNIMILCTVNTIIILLTRSWMSHFSRSKEVAFT